MNDYMRALHRIFFCEKEHTDLHSEIEMLHTQLSQRLDKADRKLLLRLLDAQYILREEISLESFTAGFKLAGGIAMELTEEGCYSFDDEIEEQMKREEN